MDSRLRETLRSALSNGDWEHRTLLRTWMCTLDNDQVWSAAIRAMRNYADAGRYHHLDQVNSAKVRSQSSLEMWDAVERAAIESDDQLAAEYQRTLVGESFEGFEIVLRSAVADSIKRWVSIVCLFGLHGVLGDDWRAIGADALPDNALPVRALPGCDRVD